MYNVQRQYFNIACQELESQLLENIELEERLKNEDFGPSCLGRWRKTCWNITEYPETSVAAKVCHLISFESLPDLFPDLGLCILFAICCHSLNSNLYSYNSARTRRVP